MARRGKFTIDFPLIIKGHPKNCTSRISWPITQFRKLNPAELKWSRAVCGCVITTKPVALWALLKSFTKQISAWDLQEAPKDSHASLLDGAQVLANLGARSVIRCRIRLRPCWTAPRWEWCRAVGQLTGRPPVGPRPPIHFLWKIQVESQHLHDY